VDEFRELENAEDFPVHDQNILSKKVF